MSGHKSFAALRAKMAPTAQAAPSLADEIARAAVEAAAFGVAKHASPAVYDWFVRRATHPHQWQVAIICARGYLAALERQNG